MTTDVTTTEKKRLYSPGYNLGVKMVQRAVYWPFRLVGLAMLRGRRIELSARDIEPGKHYVIASNHQTHVDPFVVMTLLPYPVFRRMDTVRTIAHTVFFSNVFNRSFMTGFGAFPTKEHPLLPHGLEFSKDMLEAGRTILIFPEGRMTVPGETPAKAGVGIMAQWDDVMIIPVHMDWHRKGRLGRSLNLGVGKPFSGKGMEAQEILDRVLALPVS